MATKLGAVSSLQKPFRPADLAGGGRRCLEAAERGVIVIHCRRCCFLPVMRHSIAGFVRRPARPEREGERTAT